MVNKTIKNLGLTGILAGAIVGSYSLGRMNEAERYEGVPVVRNEVVETSKSLDSHTLAVLRLKNALGNRFESIDRLYELPAQQLNLFAELYEDVDKFVKDYEIDENEFKENDLTLVNAILYENDSRWNLIPDDGKFTRTDKVAILVHSYRYFDLGNISFF